MGSAHMAVASTSQRSFFKDVQHLYQYFDSSTDGQVAVESVDDICYSLLDLVKAILYLLVHTNFELLFSDFREVSVQDSIATKLALLLAGLPVEGKRFAPNTTWCDWALENNCLPIADDVKEGYVWTPPHQDVHECLDVQKEKRSGASENSDEDPATYLHYNGTRTIPDLLLVSSHISELTQRKIIYGPGSGHKPVIASITIKSMTPQNANQGIVEIQEGRVA
nr:hypothetical protein HmN_000742200 [Hymenolepis microstoma]